VTEETGERRLQAKVLTVSDGVAAGTREDASGQALVELLASHGYEVVETRVIPDGAREVAAALEVMTFGYDGLVVTTGGTGFGPRDETPEGALMVIEREAPGMAEAMRLVNPLGRLSRATAGARGQALICTLPGSSKGATECIEAVLDVVPHALELLRGEHPH
jgi:molybdopterin adenylyltransferase